MGRESTHSSGGDPVDRLPLGDYRMFQDWSGQPQRWGPEGAGWQAWFGGKVIDGLCEILDQHLAGGHRRYLAPGALMSRREANPAAIGCVPWLTSDAVIDRLLQLGACCVVLDKGAWLPPRLVAHDRPFPNVLPGLRLTMPAEDGDPMVLGPYGPMPEHEVGPVRLAGWSGDRRGKPLLHAKVLVLGDLGFVTYSPDDAPDYEELEFWPQSVWWGSANWTEGSSSHLEVGFWCDDEDLTRTATRFVSDLIMFSEPVGQVSAGPEPNLLAVEFDQEAMWEASEAAREAYEEERGG